MNNLIDCLREYLAEFKEEREQACRHINRAAAGAPRSACLGIVPASVFELGERETHLRWGTRAANDARKPDSVLTITRENGRVLCRLIPLQRIGRGDGEGASPPGKAAAATPRAAEETAVEEQSAAGELNHKNPLTSAVTSDEKRKSLLLFM